MKKLKYLLLIIPFMFISSVKADDVTLNLKEELNYPARIKDVMGVDDFNENINYFINLYNSTYQSTYPYYAITLKEPLVYNDNDGDYDHRMSFTLWLFKEKPKLKWSISDVRSGVGVSPYNFVGLYLRAAKDVSFISRSYSYTQYFKDEFEDSGLLSYEGSWILDTFIEIGTTNRQATYESYFSPYQFYYANFNLGVEDITKHTNYDTALSFALAYDNYLIPLLNNPTTYNVVSRKRLNYLTFEPYYKYDKGSSITINPTYQEINLNDYPYIALSLKDYSKDKGLTTDMYVKGQLCVTPIYNYGLKSYDEVTKAEVSNVCSVVYSDFTQLRFYVTDSNMKNKAIYYLKSNDYSIENKIRVDTSVFNIHYITEEEKDNPSIIIDGKTYKTLPFDNLPTSANKNTDSGYVPGASCAVGDLNCTSDTIGSNIKWSDIFSSPIQFLESIWSSVTQVFTVIGYFISLLPIELQYFLYISFMLAIILGLIKIIL